MTTQEESKSKGVHGKWKKNAMQFADKANRKNKIGFLKVSKEFNGRVAVLNLDLQLSQLFLNYSMFQ